LNAACGIGVIGEKENFAAGTQHLDATILPLEDGSGEGGSCSHYCLPLLCI